MLHPIGCKQEGCWIDRSGVEYHPGNAHGVYIVTRGGHVYYADEQGMDTSFFQDRVGEDSK